MKKLFLLVMAVLGIALFSTPSQADILKVYASGQDAMDMIKFVTNTPEGNQFSHHLLAVQETLLKDLPKNDNGRYNSQDVYFYHQNLLFRMEELNTAFVKAHKTHPKETSKLVAGLRELKIKSPVLGTVTLLEVINRLKDFDWNSMGNVIVQTKALENALSAK